ncbi:MAG TPA: alkaline phosphatase family protein, partial [Planctomycetota bacterium]|nr:alkaline phosphatase family protein [Planctomycetota bacterium]
TLLTGLNPEKHGVFGFLEGLLPGETPGRDGSRPLSALSIRAKTLLDLLGGADRRVMAINVPMSYPPREVNGIMITGMLTPAGSENYTYPAELKNELKDYAIDVAWDADMLVHMKKIDEIGLPTLVRECTEIARSRSENILRLAENHPWDFAIVIFTSTDRLFHRLWPEIGALLKSGVPGTKLERLLLDFFAQLDESLGDILRACSDAFTMLVSDHGFGPRASRTVYPDVVLEQGGLLFRKKQAPTRRGLELRLRRGVRSLIEALLPKGMAQGLLSKGRSRQRRMSESIDHERTLAQVVMFDWFVTGGVRLAKETTAVMNDAEREELIDRIIELMRGIRDPETGETVVEDVWRREQKFPDAVVDFLPEIIMKFRAGYTGRINPLATEAVSGAPDGSENGVHCVEGMFVLAGEGIKALGESPAMHLADIAPSVLYMSGMDSPTYMQGKVPLALFREEYVKEHPLRIRDYADGGNATADEKPSSAYTKEQAEQVKDHLRHLGYME